MKVKNVFFTLVLAAVLVSSFALYPMKSFAADEEINQLIPGDIAPEMKSIDNPGISDMNLPKQKNNSKQMSLLDIIQKGGLVGYLIILLSIISLGLILNYVLTIRKAKILPPGDMIKLEALISNPNLNEIEALDKDPASFLAKVTIAGIRESQMGYQSMIKAMEDASETLVSRIARKIEHLNVIGNISPMMGLLGTVIGMLRCFNEIANVPGAIEPKQLAGGIFEALITTCMGLIVAIPSLYGYAVFRNRIDEYTGEAALVAEQLIAPFKSGHSEE